MIDDFYEAWRMVAVSGTADSMGAASYAVTEGEAFMAGLAQTRVKAAEAAQQRLGHVTGTLMHPRSVALRCGQLIRRERDGAMYRALSDSSDCMAPASSSMDAAQTTVERLVTP